MQCGTAQGSSLWCGRRARACWATHVEDEGVVWSVETARREGERRDHSLGGGVAERVTTTPGRCELRRGHMGSARCSPQAGYSMAWWCSHTMFVHPKSLSGAPRRDLLADDQPSLREPCREVAPTCPSYHACRPDPFTLYRIGRACTLHTLAAKPLSELLAPLFALVLSCKVGISAGEARCDHFRRCTTSLSSALYTIHTRLVQGSSSSARRPPHRQQVPRRRIVPFSAHQLSRTRSTPHASRSTPTPSSPPRPTLHPQHRPSWARISPSCPRRRSQTSRRTRIVRRAPTGQLVRAACRQD